jgi:hypothetical protein
MAIKQPKSVKLFQIQKFVMKKQTTNQRDFIKENALGLLSCHEIFKTQMKVLPLFFFRNDDDLNDSNLI